MPERQLGDGLGFGHPDLLQRAFGFRLLALRNLASTFAVLCTQQRARSGSGRPPVRFRRKRASSVVAVCGLQVGMLAEKVRDLSFDRLGQQSTRPSTQDFGELILDVCWLNQLDDVIFGHGIAPSMEKWRRQAPPRYAAFPIAAVTNFQR